MSKELGRDEVRERVRHLCEGFGTAYWSALEPDRYPSEFVDALTRDGWLGLLIPTEYGGGGQPLSVASVVLEEICAGGASPAACHAQMYVMGTLLRHGSAAQKARWLPPIAAGELRLQAFAVSEPDAGSDPTAMRTLARPDGDGWVISGRKTWISRAEHSDLMVLAARTTPAEAAAKPSQGISVFLVDLREHAAALRITPIRTMTNHTTTTIDIDGLRVGPDAVIGEVGKGLRYLLSGMSTERALVAGECVGDGRFFVRRAAEHAGEREVFGRPLGASQGVQFPIARAHMAVEAADLMRWRAIGMLEAGDDATAEAAMAKLLASEASWQAANACLDAHGALGYAVDAGLERKFREARVHLSTPISNGLIQGIVGHQVLGMPRSF
ncbi:MAG: acyl-CoA dehydrogenase domain protein [Solirubrobacterales bacterium]|nr:acyl-CoA dehydrogenase domain protein [Solirubrobacterales bacterium]